MEEDCVLRERAMQSEAALAAVGDGGGAVDELEELRRGLGRERHRLAQHGGGLEGEVHDVVLVRERGDLGPVVIVQVIPSPRAAEGRAVEKTFVADEVARDASHSRSGEGVDQRLQRLRVVAAVEARGHREVAATEDRQVACQRAVRVRFRGGVARGADAELWAEAVERERAGVELGVGGGLEQLAGVVLEESFTCVQRDNFDAELCRCQSRMLDAHGEIRAQRGEGGDGVGGKLGG